MVVSIPGFGRDRAHPTPLAPQPQPEPLGPRPGPEPAWARFEIEDGGGGKMPRKVSLHAYKPDVAAYRVLGAEPRRRTTSSPAAAAVERNHHNTGVYMTTMARASASPRTSLTRLPVVGEIAAGQYEVTVAFQDYDLLDGGVAVEKALARGGAYALKVRGTSMTHVGIEPGDMVIVRPQSWADNGDFVVANYVDGDAAGSEGLATLKRYYKKDDHVFLQSSNAATDPIRLFPARREGDRDPIRIQGVVTMVLKAQ